MVVRSRFSRGVWTLIGLAAVAVGGIGIVVPGLPTTVFFIIAAWAFSKSNPRLEAWVLSLPKVGPMVQDHRDGLGMPRRAKITAMAMIVIFASISIWTIDSVAIRGLIAVLAVVGIGYIGFRVPTKFEARRTSG